jgi:molybdopterin-guanine dinucleotide biosynthesis protein
MGILKNYDLRSKINIFNVSQTSVDNEYTLIALDFNRLPNCYNILHEIYSANFWKYLKNTYKITNENVHLTTDFTVDLKNREQKTHRYLIYLESEGVYLSFFDEEKNLDDNDYLELVEESERSNKINSLKIYYTDKNIDFVTETLVPEIKKLIHFPSIKNQFFIISINSMGGYELRGSYIRKIDVDLDLNYGEGFSKKHSKIVEDMRKSSKGLYLFHGDSGVGKTTYIRKLISELSEDKTFIYIPSYLMYELANPDLISFISQFKDSILILEDAENVLTSSQQDRTQAVSNILNMSDGLLNDAIDIQIIATFNVAKKIIDEALTRKGRLRVNHMFRKLKPKEATLIAEKNNIKRTFDKDVSLAEIFNSESTDLVEANDLNKGNVEPIGFGRKN